MLNGNEPGENATREAGTLLRHAVAVLAVAVVILTGLTVFALVKVINTGHASCVIQSRGLAAQRYLTGSLDAIHALLTLPPTAAQKRQQVTTPRAQLKRELAVVATLNQNLAAYVHIERQQPSHRSC